MQTLIKHVLFDRSSSMAVVLIVVYWCGYPFLTKSHSIVCAIIFKQWSHTYKEWCSYKIICLGMVSTVRKFKELEMKGNKFGTKSEYLSFFCFKE